MAATSSCGNSKENDALVKHASDVVLASLSTSSLKNYNGVWCEFASFIKDRYGILSPLYATAGHVLMYVSFLSLKGFASSTIVSKYSSLNYAFKLFGLPEVSNEFILQKFMAGIKKMKPCKDIRVPVTLDLLHRMCNMIVSLGYSSYKVSLYQAMIVVSFHGFLRPGEITGSSNNLQFNHCRVKSSSIKLTFFKFKHHKGPPYSIKIKATGAQFCPVVLMVRYLKLRGTMEGPLFCFPPNLHVSYSHFYTLVTYIKSALQINGKLTPHSFRIGAATWAAMKGASDDVIKRMGRWSSDSFQNYIRIPALKL